MSTQLGNKNCSMINAEHKKTVLKVPDCFAVGKHAVMEQMMQTQWELFTVGKFAQRNIFTVAYSCD